MKKEVEKIISDISYKDWSFFIGDMGNGLFIQLKFKEIDSQTGELKEMAGRKWYISSYATEDEVVRTCFLAIMVASEHEIRESFLFKKSKIFGPHISVESLKEISYDIIRRKEK